MAIAKLLSDRAEIIRPTLVVFAATVLVNGANFGFHFGAVRLLGLATYSALAALMSLFLIFSVPANVLQTVITAIVGEVTGLHGVAPASISRKIIKLAAGGTGAIVTLGFFASPYVASFLSISDQFAVRLSFVAIGLAFAVAALRGLLQGQQRFGAFGLSLTCEAVGNLVFGLGFIFYAGSLRAAVLGNVCAIFCALIFSVAVSWQQSAGGEVSLDVRRAFVKSAGTMVALGTIATMSWVDLVLVRHLMGTTASGIYGALQFVGRTILFSVAFVPLVLLAKTSRRTGEKLETRSILEPMLAIGVAICVVELLIATVAPARVISIIAGKEALAAAPFLGGYAVALVGLALTTVVASYGIGTHRFAFVIPLALIEAGEIVAILFRHDSVRAVIDIIAIGHWAALAATTLVILWSGRIAARVRREEDMPLASA